LTTKDELVYILSARSRARARQAHDSLLAAGERGKGRTETANPEEGTLLRRIIVTSAALAVALALAPAAGAAEKTTLDVSLKPAKAGAGSALTVKYTSKSDEGFETAPYQTHISFYFAKGMSFPYKDFPSCKIPKSAIIPHAKCDKARVGPGIAHNDARLDNLHNVPAKIDLFSGGPPGILFFPAVVRQPAVVNVYVKGTLKKAGGKFGNFLDVPLKLPVLIVGTEKPFINSFKIGPVKKTTVKNGRTISFINNPKTCPKSGWPFKIVTKYSNGDVSTATDSVKCTK